LNHDGPPIVPASLGQLVTNEFYFACFSPSDPEAHRKSRAAEDRPPGPKWPKPLRPFEGREVGDIEELPRAERAADRLRRRSARMRRKV
jgi:hypothetical protein